MNVKIDRQSIWMEEESTVHKMVYAIEEQATLLTLFKELIDKKYFPDTVGSNSVWVLRHEGQDLVAWKTVGNQFYDCFVDKAPMIRTVKRWYERPSFLFIYYDSVEKRAKDIFDKHRGDKFQIWHEGYMNEYQSYAISETIEKKWKEDSL